MQIFVKNLHIAAGYEKNFYCFSEAFKSHYSIRHIAFIPKM